MSDRKHIELDSLNNFAVYGVGEKTGELVSKYGASICGLIDVARTGEVFFGKSVIAIEELPKLGVNKIIIVARAANIGIIFRRISGFCKDNAIDIFDLNGYQIIEEQGSNTQLDYNLAKEEVKNKIKMADVVSFDVFDTLVIRNVLYPNDALELGGDERRFIKTRTETIELLDYARLLGKEMYFVSDMYLSRIEIWEILRNLGMVCAESHVIVSCEYGTEKADKLFGVLREKVGRNKSILHIGDSLEADYQAALANSIDDAYLIPSRLSLMEQSAASVLLKYDNTLSNRCVIGNWLASEQDSVDYIAPIVYKFVQWIKDNSAKYDMILLSARDGWLIDMISKNIPKYSFNGVYFYTSRIAAGLASCFTQQDIDEICAYPYSGSSEEMLYTRFGVREKIDILKKADAARENYKTYISKFNLSKQSKIGFVDLVTAGTCLKYLRKFVDFNIEGLFFSAINDNAQTLFDYNDTSGFAKNYFVLEEVFSSYEPTLKGFNTLGEPQFLKEKRTQQQIESLKKLHSAMIDYGRNTSHICFSNVDGELVDRLFMLYKQSAGWIEDEFCGRR